MNVLNMSYKTSPLLKCSSLKLVELRAWRFSILSQIEAPQGALPCRLIAPPIHLQFEIPYIGRQSKSSINCGKDSSSSTTFLRPGLSWYGLCGYSVALLCFSFGNGALRQYSFGHETSGCEIRLNLQFRKKHGYICKFVKFDGNFP